ncbi:hypothetical protein FSP39_008997 [Pinctada imbricata]|uniref:Uncharacterized protein n=1 Tax=Pinctada imbricata TaxID=66713 RepID=A0AA88Y8A4_PINIB|nr:hypothetical protein FSP39_008997 [Pinctada imbricata]
MAQVPHIWKVQIPSKIFPRLDFLQTTIKNATSGFQSEFQKQEEITPVYHCVMEVIQSPSIFVFSGHLMDRRSVIKLLKIPDQMLHEIEMTEYPLGEFEKAYCSTKFSETPHAFLACLRVDGEKRLHNGQTKLELSDVSRCFIEKLKPIVSYEKMKMLYAVEFNFNHVNDEEENLDQIEGMLSKYDYCDTELLKWRIFFEHESELPARICRNMETHIHERVIWVICQIKDESTSYQNAMSLVKGGEFQMNILTKLLTNLKDHLKSSLTSTVWERDVVRALSRNLAKLIYSTMLDESLSILLGICSNTIIQNHDIYQIESYIRDYHLHSHEVFAVVKSTMEEYLKSKDLKGMISDQKFLDMLADKIKEIALASFARLWQKATTHLDDKNAVGDKFAVALESTIHKTRLRLKEKLPHYLQVKAARVKDVTGISITDQTLNVYVTRECFRNDEGERIKRKFENDVHQLHYAQISKVVAQVKAFHFDLFRMKSGSHIGFPNPKMNPGVRYKHGTIGVIATEAKSVNYAVTCSHVADPGRWMYDAVGNEIGKATTELSVRPCDGSFGNFLDFTAIHTELPTDSRLKSLAGEPAIVRVFDGDFETLEGKEMFLYGATSNSVKTVKYKTNIRFDGGNDSLLYKRSKDTVPEQTMVGMDILEAVSQDKPIPGDSGSLVCYQDNNTVYAVFLFVGINTHDGTFICSRLAEGFDILAMRGCTLELCVGAAYDEH